MIIGQRIDFSPIAMFWSIVQIVIIPIGFGVALRHCFPDWCEKAKAYLPALSCLCISLLIAGLAGASRDAILASSATIMAVVVLHNLLGSALGFAIGRISGMSWKKCVALSIEVGMQNFRAGRRTGEDPLPHPGSRCCSGRHLQQLAQYFRQYPGVAVRELPESPL